MHGFIGEFFGTMILTAIGCGVGAGINLKGTFSRGQNWLFVSLGLGSRNHVWGLRCRNVRFKGLY